MNLILRACVILHHMTVEERDTDDEDNFWTYNISIIDYDDEILAIRTSIIPPYPYAHYEYLHTTADVVEHLGDHLYL